MMLAGKIDKELQVAKLKSSWYTRQVVLCGNEWWKRRDQKKQRG